MTEGRDSHYQPWLRDDAEAKGRPIGLQGRLDQARIARGAERFTNAGAASAPSSDNDVPDAGFDLAPAHHRDQSRPVNARPAQSRPATGASLMDDDNPPLGLDLDGYHQASNNEHMGQDYYAAVRAARDASVSRGQETGAGAGAAPSANRQRMRLNAVRLDGEGAAPQGYDRSDRAGYDHLDRDFDRIPGNTVAPLSTSRTASDGDSWGDLAARSGRKALSGVKNGLSRFADWTIDLGARADVPARVAALRLDEKAKAAAAKTAEVSKAAASKTSQFSKVAASKTAEASKAAAAKTAEVSKSAAARTAEVSKNAAAKTAATASALTSEGKERVGKLELGSKLGDVAGKAGGLVKQSASSVADATKAAGDSVAGAVTGAVSGVAGQAIEKTSQMGLTLGRDKAADPSSIPSALEQLLAEEQGLATPIEPAAVAPGAAPLAKPDLRQAEPLKREAPALPLFAEVPETVPTHVAPKRGSAFAAEATLFDADPVAAAAAEATKHAELGKPEASKVEIGKPLIIMPGESDTRRFTQEPAKPAPSATDEAVIIPVKPREPSAFAKRWMETKDRLGDRWAEFQKKSEKTDGYGNEGNGGGSDDAGGSKPNQTAAITASSTQQTSSNSGKWLHNSALFTGVGSLLIAGAMYSAAGALPPRGLSQEIASGSTPPLAAAGVDRADRAEIEAIVHDYILAHPEIVPQALERYQAQQMAKQIDGLRTELETPFAGAWTGAAKGDVVLVEFSDFACGYCRASVNDVERLLKDDPKLKVVHRELPILTPESGTAAKTALAAAKQGKYRDYYLAQFALGRPSPETIEAASKKAGLDAVATQKALLNGDIQSEIDKNMQMAQQLSFSGTPTFIVGDRILQGAVGYDELKKAVAEARAAD